MDSCLLLFTLKGTPHSSDWMGGKFLPVTYNLGLSPETEILL